MRHDQQAIFDQLDDLPLNEKLACLVASCLVDSPAASTEILIDLAMVMARRLEPSQRTRIGWHLNCVAQELGLRARDWN
jgi:hypothetical protein